MQGVEIKKPFQCLKVRVVCYSKFLRVVEMVHYVVLHLVDAMHKSCQQIGGKHKTTQTALHTYYLVDTWKMDNLIWPPAGKSPSCSSQPTLSTCGWTSEVTNTQLILWGIQQTCCLPFSLQLNLALGTSGKLEKLCFSIYVQKSITCR